MALLLMMKQIKIDPFKVPGLRKLAGKKDLYRVRLGNYRLIFKIKNSKTEFIRVTKRDDKSYKNL